MRLSYFSGEPSRGPRLLLIKQIGPSSSHWKSNSMMLTSNLDSYVQSVL